MSKDNPKPTNTRSANYGFLIMPRYGLLWIFGTLTVVCLLLKIWWLFVISLLLTLLGIHDITQRRHAILRNYPIGGHIRFLLENFRPEIRQYFLEDDQEQVPFSRQQRSLVYQRAKNLDSTTAFGSINDLNKTGSEWFLHSGNSHKIDNHDFRVRVGNERCLQPYDLSVFNISAMSFGALSAAAIEALNCGAKMGGFAHDTGEGSISPYHKKHGGDLIWELGTGYFGCRDEHGNFNPKTFAERASLEQVKMIEIKLSQGAKPGKGGVLPASKITEEIARTRDIPIGVDCISPASHPAFSTPRELVKFWQQLRELSGGKPVGFKLCIGMPWEFMAIVKAMIEEDNYPDFIVVDGAEGGTGAAPVEFMDSIGMPLVDALIFVQNTLVGAGIRDKIKVGVSGKLVSGFDIAKMMSLGADWCNSARGFMFAVGCIQSRSCHTNKCPTGVATQDPSRQKALDVPDKSQRVKNFHANTLKALADIVGSAGLDHPQQLKPHHIVRRQPDGWIKLLSEHYQFIQSGSLLSGNSERPILERMWNLADPDSFQAMGIADEIIKGEN
ncbi:FMN-binding glutamate synthase family protein [Neisseria weaveri]|uniref:Glutamate synthase [NADPH] large chain n=1 Tax=Neisseria weaveri TaxID=28091 RepID=A0A3S4Z1L1_9NEIS|nr:FMN-binding glutamate synthase family protein [Neisseria weaveri]EGV37253.1 ferredoxin-dependent glutamate synthase [Neisseria weaveri LMG 5135]EGV37664.1 ferredoxin-dependent glutamate synthase [Neisseria weaveri ATCC 51223]VEJ49467.1 Glutamate synthase [NADPH] large chain precursor [Neisseria weaveri]